MTYNVTHDGSLREYVGNAPTLVLETDVTLSANPMTLSDLDRHDNVLVLVDNANKIFLLPWSQVKSISTP
jgi:hypothetical protein